LQEAARVDLAHSPWQVFRGTARHGRRYGAATQQMFFAAAGNVRAWLTLVPATCLIRRRDEIAER
jgi:hypothetical protein